MKLLIPFLVVAAVLSACTSQPVHRDTSIELTTESSVDVSRYLGTWYEIARLPNSFEKDCTGVTAHYAMREDGLIRVTNTCFKKSLDGKKKVAKGRARIVDTASNAKLEVSFFGPFWGDYWIIDLDEDYSLSLVGEPSGKYLWILSRTPRLPKAQLDQALKTLRAAGYQTEALEYTEQPAP